MTTGRRKLIEVALPLEAVNREAAREKSIRHGHPSTLHLWWARRPLAACRAVLFASLVDDPSAHPDRFPTEQAQQRERQRLFRIIEELVKWENSTTAEVLNAARAEILASCDGRPPPVLDPFCGGGSIPLEAQRLGLEAHGSDLNPVAVLITKALIEIPPKFAGRPPARPDDGGAKALGSWEGARGLAEDVRWSGRWMRQEAERRIGHLYPKVKLPPEHGGGEATVIAWLWARTVRSPNPAWDGPMPLVRSFALSTRQGRETWVRPVVDREHRRIRFQIRTGPGRPQGTIGRTGAVCLATGTPVPLGYIRAEGRAGRMGAQLMAIVAEGPRGRVYLPPDEEHERIAQRARPPEDAPNATMPTNPRWFSPPGFGLPRFADMFTARQLLALCTFADLVHEARERLRADAPDAGAYAVAVATYLAFAVDKLADRNSTICAWEPRMDRLRGTFQRQALPMTWDYAEANPFGGAGGDFAHCLFSVWEVVSRLPSRPPGTADQADAASLDTTRPALIATDPPYYDNVGYADLSDFFYIWLRRSLRELYPDLFGTLLAPKSAELVATPYRFGGRERAGAHFEEGFTRAFTRMRATQAAAGPLTLFYACKQAEGDGAAIASTGWERMLEGLLRAGFAVIGTWPIRTELPSRMISSGTNALASSIVLVCRPRARGTPPATRKEFLAALKAELPVALRRLQQGNVAPVDLAQAAVGPGMGVFSRFGGVLEADGRPMTVRTALGLINRVLDETLAEREAELDTETRWALAWFQRHGMNPGPFGIADTLSKAENTAVDGLVTARIIVVRGDKVRLLDRNELPASRNAATDRRPTVWEFTQHLIRVLHTGGEAAAAELLQHGAGGLGESARALAYRLYVLCERKKWAKEALAYNAFVVSWPEIVRLAAHQPAGAAGQQTSSGVR
jgi:putative DNA methylase